MANKHDYTYVYIKYNLCVKHKTFYSKCLSYFSLKESDNFFE